VSHSRPDWSSANRVAQVQQSITFFQRIYTGEGAT
jgi:hypothetical protein